jgi:ATP-dependent DNA ligase
MASAGGGILLNEHTDHDGAWVFEHACRMGVEGIVVAASSR